MPNAPQDAGLTGLYEEHPRTDIVQNLVMRAQKRLQGLPEPELDRLLEDALYQEKRRLSRLRPPPQDDLQALDDLSRALTRGDRQDRIRAAVDMIRPWANEIHGRFSLPSYRFASKVLPPVLTALLSAQTSSLKDVGITPGRRLTVDGDKELLQQLAREATLILTPTHVSNLDSPIIGLALTMMGLPPFQYGAGLNLFSNPVMGWWMSRLGAYTVDRLKQATMYKDLLKDYSVQQLTTHHHSLFFPGGTRSRSGAIETSLKKGLLGTGISAWQENLVTGAKRSEVYIVPCTLSFQLVLEANTLIEDHLEEAGKQRYIISDDEFTQPRRVVQFLKRVLSLDSSIVCRFGQPLDVLGNPVPVDPRERAEAAEHRLGYVTDAEGRVQRDEQRDHVYTDRLADAIVKAYPTLASLMSTHVAAWTAWRLLEKKLPGRDTWGILRSGRYQRHLSRQAMLQALARVMKQIDAGAARGAWHSALPDTADELLDIALDRFARYHRSKALEAKGDEIIVSDPKLCLYYRNRATFAELEV